MTSGSRARDERVGPSAALVVPFVEPGARDRDAPRGKGERSPTVKLVGHVRQREAGRCVTRRTALVGRLDVIPVSLPLE